MRDTPGARDVLVANVVDAMRRLHPEDTAQSWDRVGLVTGDLEQPVRRIVLAVDPTLEVIAEAGRLGADMLITHHPLLLRGIHSVATTTAKGACITALVVHDIALYCAHTNADAATPGVADALAAACGLRASRPLSYDEGQPLGRVGELDEPVTLAEFARGLAESLPPAPAGIRVAGDPGGTVRRIAVLGGSGDDRFPAVRDCGADVYVTADLRHHPALEAREEARFSAGDATPYLIDAGHWASERLWLEGLGERLIDSLKEALSGPAGDSSSVELPEVEISQICTDPWDFVVPTIDRRNPADGEITP